jgi:uncharacterized protein YkwD
MLALSALGFAQEGSAAHQQPTPKVNSPSPTSHEDFDAEQELLELANQRRHEAGAPPLRMDASLSNVARAHARLMVDRQQLSHQFEGEPRLMPRLLQTGLRLDQAGENVAYNSTVEKAFEALMQSPPHRRNLLDPSFNSAGFAAFWSNGRIYVIQDFAHRLPSVTQTSLP